MIWVKRLLILIVLLVVAGVGSALLIVTVFKKELKAYVVDQLNSGLKLEIQATIGDVTLWKSFPKASLRIDEVVIPSIVDGKVMPDTMLYLRTAYLTFDLLDIIKENYQISGVHLEQGFARLRFDENGRGNYVFWEEDTDSVSSDIMLRLEHVRAKEFEIAYFDRQKQFRLNSFLDDAVFSGAFSEKRFLMDASLDGTIASIRSDKQLLAENRIFSASFGLIFDRDASGITIEEGSMVIDDQLHFGVAGMITTTDTHAELDLSVDGAELDIIRTLGLIPEEFLADLQAYESSGEMDFSLHLRGKASRNHTPEIAMEFSVRNGSLTRSSTNQRLSELEFSGIYSNGDQRSAASSTLRIDRLSGNLGSGSVLTTFRLKNFNHPELSGEINGSFELEDIKEFFALDTLETAEGMINLKASFNGNLNSFKKPSKQALESIRLSGSATITDAEIRFLHDERIFTELSGSLLLHSNSVKIKQMEGELGNSHFVADGTLKNLVPFIFLDGEQLGIDLHLQSEILDFNELLAYNANQSSPYHLSLPKHTDFTLQVAVDKLVFREFSAEELRGGCRINSGGISLESLEFKAFGGSVRVSSVLKPSDLTAGNFLAMMEGKLSEISVSRLFEECEEFGQQTLKSKHLSGKLTTNFNLKATIDSSLSISKPSIEMLVDVKITGGELNGFEPLYSIADAIRSRKLYAHFLDADDLEDKLRAIRFSTLSNQIEIQNQVIRIPFMEINSTALDIELAGTHTFDNAIDYQLNFYLTDLIVKKEEREESADWVVRKDGKRKRKVYLNIVGTVDDFEVKQNKSEYKDQLKQEVKTEKNTIKSLLKEEFNLFSNDTSLKPVHKNKQVDYDIQWEESPEDAKQTPATPEKTSKSKPDGKKKIFNLEKNEEETETFDP